MVTHVIARVLIFRADKKLLVLHRSPTDDYRPGGLDFPGGQVDDGETYAAGAAREAREESGIELSEGQLELVYANCSAGYNSSHKTDVNIVRLIFAAPTTADKVTLSDEHHDYAWMTIDEALRKLNYPSGEAVLRHIIDNKVAADLWSAL